LTTRYIYEYDEVILELDATGSQTARNVRGNRNISRTTGATVYFHHNGQGDVTSLGNASGTIVAEYYYDAWGNHLRAESQHENPYRYRGYIFDEDSGLYYLKARFYDPELARFMQEDTYRGRQSDPLSLNLYTYCHNNPIKYYDPTGHNAVMAAGMAATSAKISSLLNQANAQGLTGAALGAFMNGQAGAISAAANGAAGAVRSGGGNNPNISFVPGVGYFDGNNNQLRSNEFSFAPGDSGSAWVLGERRDDGTWTVKSTALWESHGDVGVLTSDKKSKGVGSAGAVTTNNGLRLGGGVFVFYDPNTHAHTNTSYIPIWRESLATEHNIPINQVHLISLAPADGKTPQQILADQNERRCLSGKF
jgi:RHS repeat-associated protein